MGRSLGRSAATLTLAGAAATFLAPGAAQADPQGTAAITLGAAGRGYGDDLFHEPAFHVGVRGDVLFGRDDVGDFGIGPYVEGLTHAFDELQVGGGAALLLPVIDPLPFVVSVGPYARYAPLVGFEPGIATSLFFGSRSYNFSSSYVLSLGFITEARVGLGSSRETSFVFALQVDAAFAALPFIFLAEATSPSREAERIPE
ncbi:MAG: hypothetical protein IPM79_11940 [Polyangiaceae bacterium]|nr:hypothetical protein [Polyangiaceae bacterium]MBK8938323.1 hypothetical protein [Polyangiaceae bacterium]